MALEVHRPLAVTLNLMRFFGSRCTDVGIRHTWLGKGGWVCAKHIQKKVTPEKNSLLTVKHKSSHRLVGKVSNHSLGNLDGE